MTPPITPSADGDERAKFEAWCDREYGAQAYLHKSATCGEWQAWQASLAMPSDAGTTSIQDVMRDVWALRDYLAMQVTHYREPAINAAREKELLRLEAAIRETVKNYARVYAWQQPRAVIAADRELRASLAVAAPVQVAVNWTPTAENINALPEPLRKYICNLETRCDPAGLVRENAQLRDLNEGLQAMYRTAVGRSPGGLTDDEIIEQCKQSGINWLLPDGEPGGFPGSFDLATMAEMRKLFCAIERASRTAGGGLTKGQIDALMLQIVELCFLYGKAVKLRETGQNSAAVFNEWDEQRDVLCTALSTLRFEAPAPAVQAKQKLAGGIVGYLNDMGTHQKLSFTPLPGAFEIFELTYAASPQPAVDAQFVDRAMELVRRYGLAVRRLVLEPTYETNDACNAACRDVEGALTASSVAVSLFHAAWASAKDAPDYDKKAWVHVQHHFENAARPPAGTLAQPIKE